MELNLLVEFALLARHLNYSRAARELNLTQPTLSRHIVQLEEELGVQLFRRDRQSVALTEAGRMFLPEAEGVVARYETARRRLREYQDGMSGALVLGYRWVYGEGPWPGLLQRFREAYPNISIRLVAFQDGTVHEALLVGKDTPSDLAVLKIDCRGLVPAEFGDSEALEVGDTVLAIGNPLGEELWGTMTDGIISAINRDVHVDGYTMSLIQTTAALNEGNSGGALINEYGQVVGITNLKMGAENSLVEGLGFAIPTATVKAVVDQLIAHGAVTGRPTMGITVTTITAARAEALDIPQGARVESVEPGGPAFGVLQPGDVIVEANGAAVSSTDDLLTVKSNLAAGDGLTLTLWRSGVWLERTIILVEQAELES